MTDPLISAQQLHTQLAESQPVILLDCRFNLADKRAGQKAYNEAHIPGAFYLDLNNDLSSPVQRHGGRHPLPDFNQLANTLASFGAKPDSHFVVYDDGMGAFACRAWWLLRHGGISQVSLLNGGWRAWQEHKFDTQSQTPSAPKPGHLTLSPGHMPVANQQEILEHQGAWQLVDSREHQRYLGQLEPIDPIAGHIPGAQNLPWQSAIGDNGEFKSPELLAQRWQQANLTPADDNTVVYCGSGVTACVNIFAQALCGQTARLYPGSWSDWCSYVDRDHSESSNRSARVATG
ncbi:sulfurtransferase [Simiduia sp. 21SJ11W-1]|uniref:sulfurtransferase n=1 Tax=Simiduia sp. 21SJ11W-1 TaxID=2909669 RepID=UPI0020A0D631|nr:sulfurtransferase [Simiduia sp. 21SJ11W-1]UTA46529.1 sulfurtransferase [Simiduia sp. 21SJ11W-1]